MTEEVERVAILHHIRPDRIDEYIEAHETVADSVVNAMVEGGVHQWRLFLGEEISVSYIEVEDFESFRDRYAEDPKNEEWEEHVGQFKVGGADHNNFEFPIMDEIWSLEAELEECDRSNEVN